MLKELENVATGAAGKTRVKRLTGRTESRSRIGDHRIVFEWRDGGTMLLVLKIGPRGDVYK
ncbi:MAG: hypothetical protein EXR85_08300 [Xanthomonadales bacterium]|nr:hypothetical protein [Xanthomonadales bacterium]